MESATSAREVRFKEVIDELFVLNQGTEPTKLVVTIDTRLAYPQIWIAVYAALAVIGVYLLYALQRSLMPYLSKLVFDLYFTLISFSIVINSIFI